MNFSICLLSFALCTLQTAFALYEDQIGKLDWRRQFIGRPNLVQLDAPDRSTLPSSIYFASDSNVVASVDLRSGEIKWRHCFETGERGSIDALLLSKNSLLMVRNKGMVLENLDSDSGALRWQSSLQVVPCNASKLLSSNGKVFVATCSRVQAFDYGSGALRLKAELPIADEINGIDLALDIDSETLYVVVNTSSRVQVFSMVPENTVAIPVLDLPVSCSSIALVSYHLVCVVASKNEVILLRLDDAMQAQLNVQLVDGPLRLRIIDEQRFCVIGLDGVQCFRISNPGGAVEIFVHSTAKASTSINVHSNGAAVIISTVGSGFLSFIGYNSNGDRLASSVQVALDVSEPSLDLTNVVVPQFDQSSQLPAKVLLITSDSTVRLIDSNGKSLWVRYESLSAIVSAELVDLPLSEAETIIEKEFSVIYNNVFRMFANRIVNELHLLKSYLLVHLYELLDKASLVGPLDWLFSSSMLTRQSRQLVRDHFGWHKMLVVTTEYGLVFGMDSKTGQILWTFRIAHTQPLGKFFPIFVQRTTATHPYPAQCATALKNTTTGHGVIVAFNPITGDIFETISLNFPLRHASLAPFVDSAGIAGLLLWPQDGKAVYVYPRDAGPSELLMSSGKPVFLLIVDPDTGMADSFQLLKPVGAKGPLMQWAVTKVFTLKLAAEADSEIVDFKMKALDTKVHSQGRVLGNRSVLYKYLNPNIGVALIKTPAQGSDSIAVFIFDTVSGQVLYVAKQKRVLPPYHLLVCENWIIYSYWNEKFRRTEISVIEMYEGETQANATAYSSMHSAHEPLIYHQSYIFPQMINAVAVTDTEKAITPRFLMLAMPFGGVVEMPKSFLDPRRAVNLTQELREEGIIPYTPDLPIATEHIVNYNRSVFRVRGIHTSPSGMESTSLVFVFGLDLFLTRVNPSGTFDVLKDGFDHWFIVAVLLGLSSAAIITKKLARQKDIMNAWR